MKQSDEQSKLRKYVLNDIGDDERAEIEERLLADDEFFEEILIAEESLIQDYADENLDRTEREKFEKNFLATEENRQKIQFARALRKYVNESASQPEAKKKPDFFASLKAFFSAPAPLALAVLLIVAVIGFIIWKNAAQPSEVLTALNRFQEKNRPTQARITGFNYAPKIEGTRGNSKDSNLELVSAKSSATKAVLNDENAASLHELGLVFLTENNHDEAIRQFEKAIQKNPNIAKIHNDLGAALMEKGRQKEDGKLELFARANEEIEKALELDKNLTEAYFNRALVLESLNVPNQAIQAWRKYLELDANSRWSEEARKNLERLEKNRPVSRTKDEILQDFLEAKQSSDHEKAWQTLSRNREITGKLIPHQLAFLFVDAKQNNDSEQAQKYLEALDYAGRLEAERSGDLTWRRLAEFYAGVADNKIALLKQAHDSLRTGYRIYQDGNYREAKQFFENSKRDFLLSGNDIESNICDYWIGSCLFYSSEINENFVVYNKLAAICEKENYTWLLSQVYARIGYSFSSTSRISNALAYPKKSLALAKKLHDASGIRKFSTQIAEEYKNVGRFAESAQYLENLITINSGELKWLDYEAFSAMFFKQKFYKTAAIFEKEAIDKAIAENSQVNRQLSNVSLAIILAAQEKYAEAEDSINHSLQIAQDFSDSENKEKAVAYAKLQLAHIKRQTQNYDESVNYYTESIKFYELSEFSFDKYDAYKGRLLCYLAQNNNASFKQELPAVLEMFEKYRTNIFEEQNRNSFFSDEQDIYDIAINYAFAEADYSKAFDYSEKSRSRSLLDLQDSIAEVSTNEGMPEIKLPKNVVEPLSAAQIQSEMPENVQLLEFSVLNDQVLIWLVTKNEISAAQSRIPGKLLQEKVFAYIDLISKNKREDEQQRLSKELYQILIAPVKDKLKTDKELFLIPDKYLFQLPFAALSADRYLIEDYKISYAPSANVFVVCSRRAKQIDETKPETVLSVGNPAFSRDLFDNLEPLPSAEKEAAEIAGFYDQSFILPDTSATEEKIKENLGKSDIFHFAGHYIVDENSPLLSGFVLTGTDRESAVLANYEIIGENLSQTRLIVLSACRTGIEKYYNGEGMIGASRTFLAIGVPLVVATQWQIDSEASAMLMTDFHRRRKTGKLPTAEALQQTQRAMLKDEKYRQPYYWAAFTTLGGYAKF